MLSCISMILLTASCVQSMSALDSTQNLAVQDASLRQLVGDFLEWRLREFPERATSVGFHQYDDKLESYSYSVISSRKDDCVLLRRRADLLLAAHLTDSDNLTLSVLIDQLDTFIMGHAWINYSWLNPINFLEGFHRHTGWIKLAMFHTELDYAKYLQRLTALPQQIEEIIDLLQRAITLKLTNHAVAMQNVYSELMEMAQSYVEQSVFYNPYASRLESTSISDIIKLNIRSEGTNVIQGQVQPALRRLANFINEQYMPSTRSDYGLHSLRNGTEYYAAVLRWYLSVDLTPVQLHNIGLSEVDRILLKMNNISRKQGFSNGLLEFFENLRNDSRHYNHTEVEYLDLFKAAIYQRIFPRLHSHFNDLANLPDLSIQQTTTDGIVAMYYPDTLMTNTRRPHTRPSFSVIVLSLHEGLPGHHLQVSLTRQQNLPDFRGSILGGRKFAVPYDFPYYTSNVEGWGLYAEYLGEELGVFKDDYELFSRYSYEIFRATRLVIDTGIHALGWTRDKAIEYMGNHTFLTRREIEIEVDRYITWPGQACAYKVGEMKLLQIRHKAEAILGKKFDVRSFHSAVLGVGPVSLDILDVYMNSWIESQLQLPHNAHSAAAITTHQLYINVLFFTAFMLVRHFV